MNKYALIAALAAAATMTGCLDPNYVKPGDRNNKGANVVNAKTDEAKTQTEETPAAETNKETEIAVEEAKCTCPAGAKHTTPCECGAKDCKCEVVKEQAPAEETTVYYVQRGDYLAKISKKFNVKVDAIRKLNPQLKGDKILFGQKLLLPGKLDVGKAAEKPVVPKAESAKKAAPAKFEGETKEYVVKSGDYLGKIAAESGITTSQLKELNGLSSDRIRVGQKLKIPAVKQEAKKPEAKKSADKKTGKKAAAKSEEKKPEAAPAQAEAAPQPAVAAEPQPAAAVAEPQPAAEQAQPAAPAPEAKAATYTVRDGEDVLELSIRWSVSPSEIRDVNNMSSDEELKPGQTLKVPAGVKL